MFCKRRKKLNRTLMNLFFFPIVTSPLSARTHAHTKLFTLDSIHTGTTDEPNLSHMNDLTFFLFLVKQ